jgi:hypothetical protein
LRVISRLFRCPAAQIDLGHHPLELLAFAANPVKEGPMTLVGEPRDDLAEGLSAGD